MELCHFKTVDYSTVPADGVELLHAVCAKVLLPTSAQCSAVLVGEGCTEFPLLSWLQSSSTLSSTTSTDCSAQWSALVHLTPNMPGTELVTCVYGV